MTFVLVFYLFFYWLIHFLAICDGLQYQLKFHVVIASIIAAICALFPFIAMPIAIWGAIKGWRMRAWKAVVLYIFLSALLIILAVITR